jgi:hypothetical protein
MDEEQQHLESLRRAHQKRLRALELRAATEGQNTPVEVLTELDDIRREVSDIDSRLAILKASASNANHPSDQEDARKETYPVPPNLEAIVLLQPQDTVMRALHDLIERGIVLSDQVRTSPPTSQQELDLVSSLWHRWRQMTEQTLRQAFSSLEPLQRLKALNPQHLDFTQSWEVRANALVPDIEHELANLRNLVQRLKNYPEHQG